MSGRRGTMAVLALAAGALLVPRPAPAALTCTLSSVNTLDFGSVSPLDVASTDLAQPFTITCQASRSDIGGPAGSTRTVNLCVSYNNGSGGASGGGNRQLVNAGNNALYDLYPTGAYGPTHWGSRAGAPTGTVVQASVTLVKPGPPGNPPTAPQSVAVTTYARLFGSQNTLPPGTYTSTLTLAVDAFWNDVKSDCAAGGTVVSAPTAPQPATVAYVNECRVGTIATLDFGVSGFLTSNLDAATSASVTCSSGTPFRVGLDAGASAGATTSTRRMTRTAAPPSTVAYGLFRDAARTLNWGNDTAGGSDTQNGTGGGTAQTLPIYGRVGPQDTPEPGDYQDTVVLTVAF